jgi:uncharacterized protein (TIGR03437 family)
MLAVCVSAFGQFRPAPAAADSPNLSVTAVSILANRLAWDPTSKLIYLSVPALTGAPGPAGNAIQTLDPMTGQFGENVHVAAQLYSVSISATGKYIYAGSLGSVQRYSLPGLTQDLTIPLGNDESGNPYLGKSVEASPVDDRTIAVVTNFLTSGSPVVGVYVYDDALPRSGSICATILHGCSSTVDDFISVQWNKDATRIFGADDLYFSSAPVTPMGIGKVTDRGGVDGNGTGFGDGIHFDTVTGRIFADGGSVFDASDDALVLRLNGVQLVVPDGRLGKVFGLKRNPTSFTLTSFDIKTGALLDSVTIPGAGLPADLIRWGTNGLAVALNPLIGQSAAQSAVYLISGSFVDSPVGQSNQPFITPYGIVPAGTVHGAVQSGEWISIYGGNLANATAEWDGSFSTSLNGTSVTINGVPGYLSFVSPGQINLQVPDIGAPGNAPVIVTTPTGIATSGVFVDTQAPSVLLLDGRHVAAIINRLDGSGAYGNGTYDILGPTGTSLGYRTVAARPGDSISLFALGLGPTTTHVPAGHPFTGAVPLMHQIALIINGGMAFNPSFAGLASAGLYQVNFKVPTGLGSGDVPLHIETGSVTTQPGAVISLQ